MVHQLDRGRTMDLTYISLEKKDRVAIAWLNKPKANTYDADLMRDLNTMIDDVRFDDDVDVCVIASKLDGVWSAGADINLLASSTPDYKAMFCLNCQETLNKMESTPKLFIAAIDGHCVGPPSRLGRSLADRIARGHARRPSRNGRHATTPAAHRQESRHRPHDHRPHAHAERGARLGPPESNLPPSEVLGGDHGLRGRPDVSAARGARGRPHQALGHGRPRNADVRRLRPRAGIAESPLRDGRCEGRLPRVPGEAQAGIPREVTFGSRPADVGPGKAGGRYRVQ